MPISIVLELASCLERAIAHLKVGSPNLLGALCAWDYLIARVSLFGDTGRIEKRIVG